MSRLYLERHPRADVEARYCYNGPAFRFQPKGASGTHPREFRQAGIECFGVADRDSADAEVVLLVADAVKSAGLKQFSFRFGDIALFFALLDALSLPERWRLKLRHYFWRPPAFHALLSRLARGEISDRKGPVAALTATLADEDPARAEELVANYLETNDLPLSGNRTLGRDRRAAARSRRRPPLRAVAARGCDRHRLLPRGGSVPARGDRPHRHDRARGPASTLGRRFT